LNPIKPIQDDRRLELSSLTAEDYSDESVLTEGKVDLAKLKPLLFDMSSIKYWSVGNTVADCWEVGKQMKK
jgi:hypothetical protein